MFWRFGGYANVSSLDTILDKPDVTIEELLDESDLIQELKQQNSKLIEFLREEPVLHKLQRYVVSDKSLRAVDPAPADGSEEKSRGGGFFGKAKAKSRSRSKSISKPHDAGDLEDEAKEAQLKKYAYVACEILSAEVWSITEALLDSRDHLREFWEYMKRPAPLDALQASYFTKVNEALLDKKTEEMFDFLKSLDGVVPQMLQHVDCPMVMDLLLKMISLEKHDGGLGIVDWLQSQGLIPILLSCLAPDKPLPTQTSAGDFLKAIITISANATSQDQTIIGPNELTRELASEKCVATLISDMLHGGNPLTVGVGIIIEVIRKNNSDYDLDNQVGPEPKTSDPIYLGSLLRQFSKHVPDFMRLIRSPSAQKPDLKSAFGEKIQPLGFDRFKTCELMAELLHCSNMGLLNERGSETEMRQRDIERQRLKAEGKLAVVSINRSTEQGDEQFASSVDSHGFHHAVNPGDDLSASPENIGRLEVQNASDEDGFEKVAVPDTDTLPDEVSFDDFNDKMEEEPSSNLAEHSRPQTQPAADKFVEGMDELDLGGQGQETLTSQSQGKHHVSLLTQQTQGHLQSSGLSMLPDDTRSSANIEAHPEDKPAPLFARKASPEKVVDPIMGSDSPDEDAESTVLSTATLQPDTSIAQDSLDEHGAFEMDLDGTPVIGDLLKMQFVDCQVVPTVLDFFFRFPWNNFLHNVVYDVVQQVFNGTLERGYNRTLALDLFSKSSCSDLFSTVDITQRILTGQHASEVSQRDKGMRLGYMGHLTLISEEVCKFIDRHVQERELLGEQVMERVMREDWIKYIDTTLSETREKDNAVLGGVRPEQATGMRPLGGSSLLGQSQGGFLGNNTNSSALTDAGLTSAPADSLTLHDNGSSNTYAIDTGASGLLSGFGEGEDEDDLGEERERRGDGDDEQSEAAPASAIPTALNIPPSRARRQLAARLAARRRDSGSAESDPDVADPAALEASEGMSTEDIADLDLSGPTDTELLEAGVSELRLRSGNDSSRLAGSAQGAGRFSSLFRSGSTCKESSLSGSETSGSDDSSEEAQEEQAHAAEHKDDDDDDGRAESGLRRRRSQAERKRRPSTTEARVRIPLDDEDESAAGRDETLGVAGEGEGEGPFADPIELESSSDESDDEDIVEIRPRRRM